MNPYIFGYRYHEGDVMPLSGVAANRAWLERAQHASVDGAPTSAGGEAKGVCKHVLGM